MAAREGRGDKSLSFWTVQERKTVLVYRVENKWWCKVYVRKIQLFNN